MLYYYYFNISKSDACMLLQLLKFINTLHYFFNISKSGACMLKLLLYISCTAAAIPLIFIEKKQRLSRKKKSSVLRPKFISVRLKSVSLHDHTFHLMM